MEQINRYECYELRIDSSEIVDLILPDGSIQKLVPFEKQDIHMEYDSKGIENVVKDGESYKTIRVYPSQCGIYKIKGKNLEKTFNVVDGQNHGYIKVSDDNSKYFSYSDGTPYFLFGINLAFPSQVSMNDGNEFGVLSENRYLGMRQYERWFKCCAANGINMARIWLGHEYFCVDTQNVEKFNIVNFSKIDMLISLAEKYNIKLKLTLEQFRYFDYDKQANSNSYSDDVFRKFNKKLFYNDKRCDSIHEWLTNDIWKQAWLEKVSELAKRISGNTTVFAIELWNEMNSIADESIINWNKEMAPKVKKIFPNHLVINSLGSYDCDLADKWYKDFCWETSDIKQVHRYLDQGAQYSICHKSLIELLADGTGSLNDITKPILIAETGAVNDCHSGPFKYYCCDHNGILFCDCVYSPVFLGSCGIGTIWHWDDRYVESKNLYKYYKPITTLCNNIDFINECFESKIYENDDTVLLLLQGKNTTIGYLRNKSYNWENVLRDLKEVESVKEFSISMEDNSYYETVDIWDDETANIEATNGELVIRNIKYGLFIKLTK